MLKDEDRIFKNLYNDLGADLISAKKRGDWKQTDELISKGRDWIIDEIKKIIDHAISLNLKINAGHDLNLNNLHYLVEMGNINEVSIGHAIIVDSLHYGFEETISKYLEIIRK